VKKTRRSVQLSVAAAMVTTAVLLPGTAVAGTTTGSHHGGVRTTVEVVAEGLDTPRGVTYDKLFHRVLVAEAGQIAGHDGPCAPGANAVVYCVGATGGIFQYSTLFRHGRRIVSGLPSIKTEDNSAMLGVHDLDVRLGRIHVVFGLSGRGSFRDALGPAGANLARTGYIDHRGRLVPVGDLIAFEEATNPDGRRVDSDAFGLIADRDGTIIADAGGNTLLRVRNDGTVSLLVTPPPRVFMGDPDYESVPTSVVQGPDGAYYIGELTGFPYFKGSARVLRLGSDGVLSVFAEGFTNVTDLDFDHKGRLIVLEMATEGLASEVDNVTGRLVRVERNGTQTTLAKEGLENPGGFAIASPGVFYITNRTTGVGDNGQLLKVRVHG
jgi:hypothetical protein